MDENVQRELTIKEEYQLWRKNCRYMYEFVSETALTWPSLTIQWLPQHTEEDGVIQSKLLLGTHTSGEDTNYLKVASTELPSSQPTESAKKATSRIKISKKLTNDYEINRARYMPQDPDTVATINGEGNIDIYGLKSEEKNSLLHITPHDRNGYGLSWNSHRKGYLLSSSDDKSIVLTDINREALTSNQIFKNNSHSDIVNDVKWHTLDENMFASVSDDKHAYIFDLRTPNRPVSLFYNEVSDGINSVAFSPFSKYLLAVGNTNSNINVLDLRKFSNNVKSKDGLLHTMMGHSDSITSLEFSPHRDGIIASGAQDRRLIVWDLFKIGEEQQQEDAEDGCPELFMMHAGHTGSVTDLSWCPYKDWTIGSVADDNIVHLWEVGKSLLEDGVGEIKETDLE
ncbi:histone acetyltransferase subunit [Scheffersomyces stipitis CBS 6054]|uniref:Histone acetyltransferase subunit n=1 Tax=Scheffersomyces stipitis (strain ATCC 58785 / CBS 6054 / NBRC 10063 / NRRL Y-11545) TaxID=322104 RepID=A3LWN8_PICST|nr:histone acetyltransferase subunit [Scheffersomyces stipitis CBS 6054]ABN67314.1 histone acetyltransferase subunit [Scheffersomyces stipitis CBS 6054]